ncbi:hypothetical protein [Mycoplasma sp. E35C]|uniref:hypothetical protein n=1 Tax=Mycoplasma sp. E35C TaxID=2801918 RepID=UPI001CA38B2D|nr:hypothetical protein [Mycoplasma sp. E35C]QZX49069.1 hypothetical protein JJE79_03360 [Mycoplasma sp. E35C]
MLVFSLFCFGIFFFTKTKHTLPLHLIVNKGLLNTILFIFELIHLTITIVICLLLLLLANQTKTFPFWNLYINENNIDQANDWFQEINFRLFRLYGFLSAKGWNIVWFLLALMWISIYLKLLVYKKKKALSLIWFSSIIVANYSYEELLNIKI